jgi:Fe-S-cluster containining protein
LKVRARNVPSEYRPAYKACLRCDSCCMTHPCALAPSDLMRIAVFLGISSAELFRKYLVLDYDLTSGKRRYYACPARVGDEPGTIVPCTWTLANSPCVFLRDNSCTIEQVKPHGGRVFACRLMTASKRNRIGYGKKKAAKDWSRSRMLDQLMALAQNDA